MVPMSTRLTHRAPILATPSTNRLRRQQSPGWLQAGAALLGAVAVLALLAAPALAQDKKTVTVLEIQGAPPKLQAALEKALKGKFIVLPAAKWNAAAKRLNVTGQATDEVALVAGDLKIDAVVTGKVKADKDAGTYKLNIAARHGATGKPIGKLTYELKSAKVDPATITQAEGDIEKAVDEAIAGPPPDPPPVVAAVTPPRVEDENPLEKMRKMEEQAKRERDHVARPVYYPYFDVGAGFILNGRSFNYAEESGTSSVKCYDFQQKLLDPNDSSRMNSVYRYTAGLKSCPRYATSVTGGVRVDLTGYPLAGVGVGPIRGLGIGVTFDYMFWPASMTSGAMPRSLETREYRLEAGLRYHWNVANKRSLPSILVNAQYGMHFFAVAKENKTYTYVDDNGVTQMAPGIDDHGLPDILYQYVNVGVGVRVPYYATDRMFFGLLLNGDFHIVLNVGEMGTNFANTATAASLYGDGGYGPASAYGFRVGFTPLEMMPFKGLTVRVNGFFEMFQTSFALGTGGNTLPPVDRTLDNAARHIAQGATDQYFGGVLQVGYQY